MARYLSLCKAPLSPSFLTLTNKSANSGQNVFTSKLISGLTSALPGFNPALVLSAGATSLQNMFPPEQLPAIIQAYNDALTQCFYPSVAMAVLGFVGCFGMEWASVKGKKIEMGAAA